MPFLTPMFASPLPKDFNLQPDTYIGQEKYDGIRIVVEVKEGAADLFTPKTVTPWSRYGKIHPLPSHITSQLAKLPDGIYDGEVLAPGKRSYGATEIKNQPDLIYYIFDIIQFGDQGITALQYENRHTLLSLHTPTEGPVQLAPQFTINNWDEVLTLRDEVWARDGEGLILKRLSSIYKPGKRPKGDWIKIKKLQSAVLTVIDFQSSKGQINNRGPYAMVVLQDDEGNVTTVKTRNDAECRRLESIAAEVHPDIGRKLRIEFQERTPDFNYRHPRFDRWEDE